MSGWNPQISDWMNQGLEWQYIHSATMRPFTIPANGQVQLPLGAHTFDYPEGVLMQFSAAFDNPACGIRIESHPNFDTGVNFTVNTLSFGLTRPDILVYTSVPPVTPAGVYVVRIGSSWIWKTWLRLYLINTDSVPHRVIGHGYDLAVLRTPRLVKELSP